MWRYGRREESRGGGGGVEIREGRRDGCRRRMRGKRRREGGLIKPDLCHGAFMAVGEAGGRG